MENSAQIASFPHQSVLLKEVIEGLELQKKKVIVDGTLGLGGHALALLENSDETAKLLAFEVDDDNLKTAKKRLKEHKERVIFIENNFSALAEELQKLKIKGIDAILLDLGLSSPQVDNAEKGFSFMREGPLDMRFNKNAELTAAEVINTYGEKKLVEIFQVYGEEKHSRKIAREIVKRRKSRKFKTTTELAKFIEKLAPRVGHIHPATRVFQALRIETNHELEVLQSVLEQVMAALKKGGRVAVISYHSLEDRIVKNFFRAQNVVHNQEGAFKLITKKPVAPTDAEIRENPRSRSAKLRIAEKI